MREDMFKIIVERPRRGKGRAVHSRKRLTEDGDLPTKIGIRRHMWLTHAKSKWLSENLAPLKRYLGKQIGRRWNDVHSDIHATIKSRDPVQMHVLQHLDQYVARYINIDRTGAIINPQRSRFGQDGRLWWQPYFVDPADGRLKDSTEYWKKNGIDPKPWKRKEKSDPNVRVLDGARTLRNIDGIWYELIFIHDRTASPEIKVFDLDTRTTVRGNIRRAISKRQLSHEELLAHRLANHHN